MVFCQREPFWDEVRFWFKHIRKDGFVSRVAYAQPLTLVQVTPENEGVAVEPTFRLKPHEAQYLMDDLWRAGFRPTEGKGSAGSLAATERHLEDMRALVFKADKPK